MNNPNRYLWRKAFPSKWFLKKRSNVTVNSFDAIDGFTGRNRNSFPLMRYFTYSSLAFFLIAIVILNYAYRRNAISDLVAIGEKENASLAQFLSNSLQTVLKPYLVKSSQLKPEELTEQLEIAILQNQAERYTKNLSIVKIKVYNLQGTTIFSTEPGQIGKDKSQSTGFQTALTGKLKTELGHRDTFGAIRGKIEDRKLLSSYVPIVNDLGETKGVFELYNDVTPLVDKISRTQLKIIAIVGFTLGLLYLVLLAVVSRANKLINNQQLALKESQSQYQQKAAELEQTVIELQQTQSQLVQQEKMAALGQLVAGIAHEINTPLGAIQASAGNTTKAVQESIAQLPLLSDYLTESERECFFELIDRAFKQDSWLTSAEKRPLKRQLIKELKELEVANSRQIADTLIDLKVYRDITPFLPLLKHPKVNWILNLAYNLTRLIINNYTIQTAVERASKIVFALKNYARQDTAGEKQLVKVTDGIETVLQIYHNQIKRDIELVCEYQDTPEIWCYPDELMQVWTNLIHNAIQAIDRAGTLKISTELEGDRLKVSIADTGSGIPLKTQARIFDAFYTTKPAGEGSGLGLHITQQIITKHQGSIEVTSQPGHTVFNVYLPTN